MWHSPANLPVTAQVRVVLLSSQLSFRAPRHIYTPLVLEYERLRKYHIFRFLAMPSFYVFVLLMSVFPACDSYSSASIGPFVLLQFIGVVVGLHASKGVMCHLFMEFPLTGQT